MVLSGITESGIPYPQGGLDPFAPAGALQAMAHALEEWMQSQQGERLSFQAQQDQARQSWQASQQQTQTAHQTAVNNQITALDARVTAAQNAANQRPRFIQATTAQAAQTNSNNDRGNIYWVRA